MSQLLRARRLLTGQGWLEDHQLRIEASSPPSSRFRQGLTPVRQTCFARHTLISTSTAARVWM